MITYLSNTTIFIYAALFVIYVGGFFVSVIDKQKYLENVTTKDVWMSLIWPVIVVKVLIWTSLFILHELISYLLLAVFIKYRDSELYKRVNSFLDV